MNDYISREAAKRLACQLYCAVTDTCDDDSECAIAASFDAIPAADVRENKRGRWIDEPIKGIRYHCSVCQGRFDYTWHFCPNCGADMREES